MSATSLPRHQTECKQIYSPLSLTDSQRDVFIRKLFQQMNRMSTKITELQTEISYLKKKQKNEIATLLNNQSSEIPSLQISQWIKTIPVSQTHLELVFRKSLEDGIKQVIIDACVAAKTVGSNIPIRAYSEKQKCIFVYSQKEEPKCSGGKWMICDNTTFRKICGLLASRFIELFVLWQTTQDFTIVNDDENHRQISDTQEQNMHFMKKVMDNTYTQFAHISKMIEDIHTSIQVGLNISDYA
jgi:gas vesicle protein